MKVLAEVEHELLEGSEIEMSESELSSFRQFERLPSTVEDKLARDTDRNNRLLQSIRCLDARVGKDWTAILFAASVTHAEVIAALLNLEGIRAAAISGKTEPGARKYYVEKFRNGEIQVIANYGVLTQGFDAPAVRDVDVARPTLSPNLYQQMIGRGLRGPLNKGKDRCLIVNVRDNLTRYGLELAFKHFETLWISKPPTNNSD